MRFVKQEVRRRVVPGCDGEEGEGSREIVRGCARGCPFSWKAIVRLTFLPYAHASYGRGLGWWQHGLYLGRPWNVVQLVKSMTGLPPSGEAEDFGGWFQVPGNAGHIAEPYTAGLC